MKRNAIADRYDRVASSAPVNADAARIYGARGERETLRPLPETVRHFDAPPKILPVPASAPNRTGKKYGALTVIGYLGPNSRNRGSEWLVRCLCGQYEVRRAKAVDKASPHDCCARCNQVRTAARSSQRQAYFDRHGKWPP